MKPYDTLPDSYHACRVGFGCMRIAGDPDRGRAALIAAWEAGYRLFDHADIYSVGRCETLFGALLREMPAMRASILIQSKVGIRFADEQGPGRYDFSREHLLRAVDGCLERLGVPCLDLLLLHRIDLLADADEIAAVIDQLHTQGKVQHFGLSNASNAQFRMLAARSPRPLVANQIEINLDRISALSDGSLDLCQELGHSPQAWCPLAGIGYPAWGRCADSARWRLVEEELARQATRYDTDPAGIALAWLLRPPARIMPLIGSCTPERIRAATAAVDLDYAREDWYRLYCARQGAPMA